MQTKSHTVKLQPDVGYPMIIAGLRITFGPVEYYLVQWLLVMANRLHMDDDGEYVVRAERHPRLEITELGMMYVGSHELTVTFNNGAVLRLEIGEVKDGTLADPRDEISVHMLVSHGCAFGQEDPTHGGHETVDSAERCELAEIFEKLRVWGPQVIGGVIVPGG